MFIIIYGAKSSFRMYNKPFILLFCRLFKCCGWTLSWTHLLPWPWPLRCQLLNYCYENPMAVQRPLFLGQWPKIYSDKPYTNSSLPLEWCFTVSRRERFQSKILNFNLSLNFLIYWESEKAWIYQIDFFKWFLMFR